MNIISASRRTDVVAWYYDHLQNIFSKGYTMIKNPYNTKSSIINLTQEDVHSIVLWSKNYSNFLSNPGVLDNYNLYFNFTITGLNRHIEKCVPDSSITVAQMGRIAEKYGANKINWRFDPLMFPITNSKNKPGQERLQVFNQLCKEISKFGVKRCTISFLSLYEKVEKRLSHLNINYYTPSDEEKIIFLNKLVEIASLYGITLYSCASPFIEQIPQIQKSHCIDGALLEQLFNKKVVSKAHDSGQRPECGCSVSVDIADYNFVCKSSCSYCYANTLTL